MKSVVFPDGTRLPALGQGTWHMGMKSTEAGSEANAIRYGLDNGLTLIDTAEMYHDAELVVADAICGRRDDAFIVSKVLPGNASREGTIKACEKSLQRLGIECLDLYLLHWVGNYAFSDTLEAFDQLVSQGKIKRYGVSNFDLAELEGGMSLPLGTELATNQVLYNLHCRGIEWDLLPFCQQAGIPVMAYSPLNQGNLAPEVLNQIGARHNVNGYQIALAWVMHHKQVMAIPKASKVTHIDRNIVAAEIELSYEEIKQIDMTFPPPKRAMPLEMI